MIELERASRWYGQVIGVNDVSVSIGPGITGLLGENGAGKSTLIKLITGQLKPTTGAVRVFGENPFANTEVFRRLGYCPETDSFYESMTCEEFLRLMVRMAGIPKSEVASITERNLSRVGMLEHRRRKLAACSKGMRQRIKIAQAIAHEPELLILDEPMNGLDPLGRKEMGDLLSELGQDRTIIVSSHILYEVEALTRRILLLHRGRLLAYGDVRQIRDLIDRHPHKVLVETTDRGRELATKLIELASVLSVRIEEDGKRLIVETAKPDEFYTNLAQTVLAHQIPVRTFYSQDNNLEAVFRYLVKG
ncbi:MAG: ABC transporter ATP-binding protein [Armatimonadetes bacterium]|nr:MAG: ABC transporter ATP-binding protein [Armatimonadota bacterium]